MAQIKRIVVPRGQMFGGSGVATLTTYTRTQSTVESSNKNIPLDLNNLPFDPAEEAMRESLAASNKQER